MSAAAKRGDSFGLTGNPKYRSATAFLLFALLGPPVGTLAFIVGLFLLPSAGTQMDLKFSIETVSAFWDAFAVILMFCLFAAPAGYVIGFPPAIVTGFLFLLMHAYGGLNHSKACLLLILAQAAFILLMRYGQMGWGFPYDLHSTYQATLIFIAHAIPTFTVTYIAWRIYSGRWLPKPKQQEAFP